MLAPNILDMYHGDDRELVPDFAQLKTFGIWGIIHKATQGLKYIDPKFHVRLTAAQNAGLLVGAYHYLDATDPLEQADSFLAQIAGIENLLVAVDYEKSADGNHPAFHQLYDFMSYIDRKRDQLCVLYGSDLIRETIVETAGGNQQASMERSIDFIASHRLWLAEYGPSENVPKAFEAAWLWQYKSNGHLPNVIGNLDLNFYPGSHDQLVQEWFHGPANLAMRDSPTPRRGNMPM